MRCARCEHDNPAVARFCNQCGNSLAAAAQPEQRRLTVMFCDLVGSVALAARLDPEEWHGVLRSYLSAVSDAVKRHEGHVAQYLGDGVMIYFGYPLAHENDAERAVRAALDALAALRHIEAGPDHAPLSARIGVHTGTVVMSEVGSDAQRETLALGEAPNIAARLQSLAAPGTIAISDATQRIVRASFRCRDLGTRPVKGLSAPIRLWEVSGAPEPGADGEVRNADRLTPLVGRAREFDALQAHWRGAAQGRGACVLLRGEPGIGKSRLVRELRDEIRRQGNTVVVSRCSAYHCNTAFFPLVDMLERVIQPAPGGPANRYAGLERLLAPLGPECAGVMAPLAALLSIALPEKYAMPPLSAQAMRERTFDALITMLRATAAARPALFIVEDLHWADPSTLEFLGRSMGRIAGDPSLLLLTARSDFRAPWPSDAAVAEIALDPCADDDATAIVGAVAGADALPPASVARIVARAEGIPLFIEELTRAALESGDADIPGTLHEQLTARLDRLGPAKSVLQQASVIGRSFSLARLQAASGLDKATLDAALERCVGANLLARRGAESDPEYAFRHALLQDAACQSLLRSARQQCHLRVAQAILADASASAESQPELLAYHYTEAALPKEAIAHWQRAAQRALARSACVEAAAHVQRGLALIRALPQEPEVNASELELLLVLAPALMALRGVADPEVEQAYARARTLCGQIGSTPKLLVPLWGLWAYALVRGRMQEAQALATQLSALAEATAQPASLLVATETLGMTRFYRGDLRGARGDFARGLALYRAPERAGRTVRGVHDPGVMCHAFEMLACWLTGFEEEALLAAARLRQLVAKLAPYDVAFAWCADAVLRVCRREPGPARASADQAIALAREQGFTTWHAMGSVLRGWAVVIDGQADGLPQARRGYEAWCATGAENLRPFFLALLGDACLAGGQRADARVLLDEALAAIDATGERWWEAEVHRLRGEAQLPEDRDGAESSLRRALDVARGLGATAWERRAEISLAKLSDARAGGTR